MSDEPMPTPSSESPEPQPVDETEVTVGPVNVAFTPLEPEDIVDAASPSRGEEAAAESGPAPTANEPPSPPPLQTAPSGDNALLGCLRDILVVLVSMLLAVVFVFALLLAINGTLRLNEQEKTTQLALEQAQMKRRLATMEAKIGEQAGALNGMHERLDGLQQGLEETAAEQQALAGRVDALNARADEIEQAAETVRQDVVTLQSAQQATAQELTSLDARVGQLEDEVQGIQTDLADFKKVAERFNRFVEGLTRLIAEVAVEGIPSQPAVTTPQPEITQEVTATITSTLTITPTATMPPAETPTPSPPPLSPTLKLFPPAFPLPTPAFDRGIIFGLVWNDANGNGQPDPGEEPVSGAVVALKTTRGRSLLNMVTGADGRFAFINVPPDAYLVVLRPTDAQTPTTDVEQTVQVQGGESIEVNFGIR